MYEGMRAVAKFNSLSPPNGERVGVRGKYLKIKHLLTLTHSSIGNGNATQHLTILRLISNIATCQ
jgi:hypothetical protein